MSVFIKSALTEEANKGAHEKRSRKVRAGNIQPLYLTRFEIGIMLSMSETKARKILAEHGVNPIDLGRGRGNGLRWRTSAVINVADILHAEAQAQSTKRRRNAPVAYSVIGKTAAELYVEFNGNTPMNAEVCNGN